MTVYCTFPYQLHHGFNSNNIRKFHQKLTCYCCSRYFIYLFYLFYCFTLTKPEEKGQNFALKSKLFPILMTFFCRLKRSIFYSKYISKRSWPSDCLLVWATVSHLIYIFYSGKLLIISGLIFWAFWRFSNNTTMRAMLATVVTYPIIIIQFNLGWIIPHFMVVNS